MFECGHPGVVGSEDCQKGVACSMCKNQLPRIVLNFRAGFIDGAGVDTTQAIIRRFVYAMAANPRVQRRAQEELDGVTGDGRLPTLDE